MFISVLEKHLGGTMHGRRDAIDPVTGDPQISSSTLSDLTASDGVYCLDFFPGTTSESSQIFAVMYAEAAANNVEVSFDMALPYDFPISIQDLFDQSYDGLALES